VPLHPGFLLSTKLSVFLSSFLPSGIHSTTSFGHLLSASHRYVIYEGWSKISWTEFIVGKWKHLQVTRSYLLQSTTLQIVCSDSSDPSTFQCMSGRLVLEWPACNCRVVFSCISATSSNRFSFRVLFSLGKRKKSQGTNLVTKAGGEPRGCCAWPRIP
jgi:hypothetical protein